ncbi:MAG: hypothetical protein J6T10_26055 [Methanobrevibacter sp.]|nr:hypothetical protein [Methanobrevibacter sp.]
MSGDVITKVGVAVLTGDENWLKSPAWGKVNTNVFYYSVPDGKIWTIGTAPLGETLTVYTHFKSVSRNYIYDADEVCAGWSGGSSAFSLTVRVSNTIDTAADFKQWLASQLAA